MTDASAPSRSTTPRLDPVDLAAQLLNPGTRDLARDAEGGELADQLAHHAGEVARLRDRATDLRQRKQGAQATRTLFRAMDHERRRLAIERALAVAHAPVPSLLDQVVDAIESSSGEGTRSRSHAHRSPIGLAAAQLVTDIERTVGAGPRAQLARRVWGWAVRHSAHPATTATLSGWLTRARSVVEPARPLDLAAPCPACGESVAWVPDDSGLPVRRTALQVDRISGEARCVSRGCGARWSAGALTLLAQVLEAQHADRMAQLAAEQLSQQGQREGMARVVRIGALV